MSTQQNQLVTAQDAVSVEIERVLLSGDLAQLKPEQRLSYYNAVCKSLNLNPLTKPFAFIQLNGKLQMYALKDCTEQLRNNQGISVKIVSREAIEGVFVVVAGATKPNGRCDESIGAVPIEGLKGEAKANAIMKAETKAKRRVTLSICGLGMLDETEVNSIPGAVPFDAGGTPVGSQKAADEVAAQKIAQLQSPQPRATQPQELPIQGLAETDALLKAQLWERMRTLKGCIDVLQELKVRVTNEMSESVYYEALSRHGMAHANECKGDLSKARMAAAELAMLLNKIRQAPDEPEGEEYR